MDRETRITLLGTVPSTSTGCSYCGVPWIISHSRMPDQTGINSEDYDSLGHTPIHVAVLRNHRECVRILLDNDRAYGKEFHRAWTVMRIAAIQGRPEFARLAIETEADFFSQPDPIAISYRGWSVLHEAVLAQHVEIVEILCDSGFEVDSVDLEGNSALHLAATEGYDDILRTLVRKGADINKRNKCGETPLHRAATKSDMAWPRGTQIMYSIVTRIRS